MICGPEFIGFKVDVGFIDVGKAVNPDVTVEVGVFAGFNDQFAGAQAFKRAFYLTGNAYFFFPTSTQYSTN